MHKKFLLTSLFCIGLVVSLVSAQDAHAGPFGRYLIDDDSSNDGAPCINPRYKVLINSEPLTLNDGGMTTKDYMISGATPVPGYSSALTLDCVKARKASDKVRVVREYGMVHSYKRTYDGVLGINTTAGQTIRINLTNQGLTCKLVK